MKLGGYQVKGRIDRVDEVETPKGPAYEVLDYKSGSGGSDAVNKQIEKFLPPEGAEPADYQLPLYALALLNGDTPVKARPHSVSFYNLESLERGKRGNFGVAACRTIEFVARGSVDTKAGLVPLKVLTGDITHGILETLGRMSASPYSAKPDYRSCQYCAFRAACERGRAQKGEGP